MRFGLITPVFDGCLESLELLYRNIAEQTHEEWVWVLCGNQFSERMSSFAKRKQNLDGKSRVVYFVTNLKDEKNPFALLANIGKRRDICIRRFDADYFLMINADSKILDREMLSKVNAELQRNPKDLCIYKIIHNYGVIYPRYPFTYEWIDSFNFCVSSNVARKVGYPSNANYRRLNDWRFFVRVFEECGGDYCFIDEVFGEYNGNNRYKNVLSILWRKRRFFLLNYISYCLRDNYFSGLLIVLKEVLVYMGVSSRLLFEEKIYVHA